MLLAMNQPAEALAAYEITLKKEPNRFRALLGAASAAAAAKNGDAAQRYRKAALDLAAKAQPGRPELDALKRAGH